jgi:MFS family permease
MPGWVRPSTVSHDAPGSPLAIAAEEKAVRQRVTRDPAVRALILSRFSSTLGIVTLTYGAMIYLATVGASQMTVSLMGATRYLAALLFGIGGGALANAMSKRSAMATAYALQAAACFIVPAVLGTSVPSLIFLVFLVSMLGQIITPAAKAATALFTTAAQVAVAAALISVAGGIGSAVGTAFLAPFLIKLGTVRTITDVAGVVLILGAVRTLQLPARDEGERLRRAIREVDWRASIPTLRRTALWVSEHRQVGAMILVGSMVLALFDGMSTLMPVYVRDVLQTDPTNTVYILAPGGIGFFVGTMLGPWLMDRRGERALGVMSLAALSLGFVLFGLIDVVAPFLAPISPLRLLGLFGIELTPEIEAAGLISILTALGSTGAGAAVQTYVNRYILFAHQAATFGMQEVLENALTLFAVLSLGGLASQLGSRLVFVVAPPLILALVVGLIRVGFRITAQDTPETRAILRALLATSRPEAATPSERS